MTTLTQFRSNSHMTNYIRPPITRVWQSLRHAETDSAIVSSAILLSARRKEHGGAMTILHVYPLEQYHRNDHLVYPQSYNQGSENRRKWKTRPSVKIRRAPDWWPRLFLPWIIRVNWLLVYDPSLFGPLHRILSYHVTHSVTGYLYQISRCTIYIFSHKEQSLRWRMDAPRGHQLLSAILV